MKDFQKDTKTKKQVNINLNKRILLLLMGFLLGIVSVVGVFHNNFFGNGNSGKGRPFAADSRLDGKYKFIKPILNSGYGDEDESLKWFPAERRLKSSVQDIVNENPDINASVFFLNLENSGWFGVNSSDEFIPASLLKLPMLISYYKLRETEKDLFDQKIYYQGEDYNKFKNIGNGRIVSGQTYAVRELLKEMIVNSDNNALQLLYKYRENSLKLIFDDLKIALPSTDEKIATNEFVTSRDVGRFLLVLYNGSYLNFDDSEEVLQLLSQTTFKDGLVAGVPNDIVVSHKFGERTLTDANTKLNTELHDCGIVYSPEIPYVVCIMTKGNNFDAQKSLIQKISKKVYEDVRQFSSIKQ